MRHRAGWVTPHGREPVCTLDLIAVMRRHRGRLTRRELCQAVDLNPDNPLHYGLISRLCRDYAITCRDPPARRVPKHCRAGEVRNAKASLAEEIRLARMEAPFARPFRGDEF